jgi:hypothetical protein
MSDNTKSASRDEYLGQVDVHDLSHYRWPIIRAVAGRFVDRLELRQYQQQLLNSGKWQAIRAEPHRDEAGVLSSHVFDLYVSPTWDPLASRRTAEEVPGGFCS